MNVLHACKDPGLGTNTDDSHVPSNSLVPFTQGRINAKNHSFILHGVERQR